MTAPTFEETVTKAARAVYARTPTSKTIMWDLLPRNVQEDIESMARTAIVVALRDLYVSIKASQNLEDWL